MKYLTHLIHTIMNGIETKELKGINIRSLVALVATTITICSVIILSKNSIENSIIGTRNEFRERIQKLEMENTGDAKYMDLRIRTIELNINALEIRNEKLKSEMDKHWPNK